jgi:hypothetical protein
MGGKVPTLIASVIAILALAAAWHEYELAQNRGHSLADALQQASQLNRQLVEAKASQDQAKRQIAQLSLQNEAVRSSRSANPNRNIPTIHLSDIVKDHPEYAELHAKDVRHRIIYQYGAALLALNLPPDQLAKAKNLLVERQLSATDAMEVAQANGLAQGSPEWRAAIEQATAASAQDLDSILQTYANTSLNEFELVASTRVSSGINLGSEINDAGLPLTDAQAQAIAQASADASDRSPGAQHPPNYNTPDPTTGLTPKQTQMINQVTPALSPAQLEIYKTALLEMMQRNAIENQYGRNPATGMMP